MEAWNRLHMDPCSVAGTGLKMAREPVRCLGFVRVYPFQCLLRVLNCHFQLTDLGRSKLVASPYLVTPKTRCAL